MGENRYAVFFVHPRESVSFYYERAAADPRVAHEITLEVDAYGSAMRGVFIGYPRRSGYAPPEPALSAATQSMLAYDQTRLHVRATEQQYTNAIDDLTKWPDSYRTPLLAATIIAEITGIAPSSKGNGITSLFSFQELDGTASPPVPGIWQDAWSGAHDIPYEAVPASDIDGTGAPAGSLTRRVIARNKTLYRSDDLSALLPQGRADPRAVSGQSYRMALTSSQLNVIIGAVVPASTLTEGGYVQLPSESGWWAPSSRVFFSAGDNDTSAQELAAALTQFFQPRRAIDPLGAISRFAYDAYALLPASVTDPVGNVTTVANDYRVLAPAAVTDANGNTTSAAFDALGMVTAMAVMGKPGENFGDMLTGFVTDLDTTTLLTHFADPLANPAALLGNATSRIVYDLNAYQRTSVAAQPSPPASYTLVRETHSADIAASVTTRYQSAFAYSDGSGREIQRKSRVPDGPVTTGGTQVSPRWGGSGWTIFDNKGRPVRRYEPFFSATNAFEFAAQAGVSTIVCYDPPGRTVAVLHPDNTWEKVIFDPWRQEGWDAGDTALIGDPRSDADVGGYFQRILGTSTFTSWYTQRIGGVFGATAADQAAQQDAAQKSATYAATSSVAHFDSLGRVCLAIADSGGGNRCPTRTALDTEGRPLVITDALGRRAQEFCFRSLQAGGGFQYLTGADMLGSPLCHINADAGARRGFRNVVGKPIRSWDARGHAFRMVYDAAQRPTQRYVSTNGGAETLIELTVYGEGQTTANMRGRVFRHYDMAGYVESSAYDFKGNLLSSARQLALSYEQAIDWTPLGGLQDGAALDSAARTAGLIPNGDGGRDRFVGAISYDALNRPIQMVTPHNAAMKPNVLRPSYDAGGLLTAVDAWLQQAMAPTTLLDPTTADHHAVTAVAYNARGQKTSVAFGNGATTAYDYDAQTFRLVHLTTARPASFTANQQTVQALSYFYDPTGNITRIRDTADLQDVIYFNNQRVEPTTDYSYDALYRLIRASGREHLGQTGGVLNAAQQATNDDSLRLMLPQPGDGNAMGTYTETYTYDVLSNLLSVAHQVGAAGWSRRYGYAEPSLINPEELGNRLSSTSLPGDSAAGPFTAAYAYDAHGNMTRMPHLPAMMWDEDDRLRSTTRQVVNSGTPVTTYYVYDSAGARVRKVTNGQAAVNQTAVRQSERIYLGGFEIFREYAADGTTIALERETLPIAADKQLVALVETRAAGSDAAPAQQVRYQFNNHLGSAVLELDGTSNIISYEEYFPYGATSYQAVASQTDLSKRYRYTGKERDGENDLYYHGARYSAPWLGRWTACDPLGVPEGLNLYLYAEASPVCLADYNGMQASNEHPEDTDIHQYWKEGTSKIGDSAPPDAPESVKSAKPPGPSAWDKFSAAVHAGYDLFKQAVFAIGTAIKHAATTVWHWLKDTGSKIAAGVEKAASAIADWAKNTAEAVGKSFKDAVSAVGNWFRRTAAAVGKWFRDTASSVGNWFRNTATAVGNWFKKTASMVENWFKRTATAIADWTKHTASVIADHVKSAATAAGKWIKAVATTAWNATKTGVTIAAKAVASAAVTTAKVGVDVIGKIWASPNTIIALLIGLVWLAKGAKVSLQGNAITFNNVDFGNHRPFTMGNVVFNPGADAKTDRAPTYDHTGTEPVGQHEEAHTYQYQLFGPLFFFAYLLAGGAFGPKSPFEHGADRYGTTGKGWMPY
jgi:RHS repeat-associated protein